VGRLKAALNEVQAARRHGDEVMAVQHIEVEQLQVKVDKLWQRLRDQTHQTQITAQQMTDRVHEVLTRKGVVPEGMNLDGHPVEQNVGTIISTLLCGEDNEGPE
jgi:hypothetical protein